MPVTNIVPSRFAHAPVCLTAVAPRRRPTQSLSHHATPTRVDTIGANLRSQRRLQVQCSALVPAFGLWPPSDGTAWRTLGAEAAKLAGPATLMGKHPFLTASGSLVGAVAAGALMHDIYKRLSPQDQARVRQALADFARLLRRVEPYLTSTVLGAASGTLAQEGGVRLLEARHVTGALMLLGALWSGLVGAETLGKKLHIPVVREAWSGPRRFFAQHPGDWGAGALGAAGAGSAWFATHLLASGQTWGWLPMAGAVPAMLGSLELLGREHKIDVLKECLTRPVMQAVDTVRQVMSRQAAVQTVGGAVMLAGVWGAAVGMQHLGMPSSGLHDALGAAQVTAGVLGIGLGTGLANTRGKPVTSATGVLSDRYDAVISGALAAWGTATGKFAAYSMLAAGPNYLNTGAAAAAFALNNVAVVAAIRQLCKKPTENGARAVDEAIDKRLEKALDRVSAFSGSMMTGGWAALVARGLLQGTKGSALLAVLNAVVQLGAAAALGAVSVGMMGFALDNATMKNISNDVADDVKDVAETTLRAAQAHPAPTLGMLALLLWVAKQTM